MRTTGCSWLRKLQSARRRATPFSERSSWRRCNGADRYDFLNKPHYHAKCRVCGGVFDIDMPYQHDIASYVSDAHGFAIEHHEIIFDGVCAECQAKG